MQSYQKIKKRRNRIKYSVMRFAPLILVIYLVIEAFTTFQKEDKRYFTDGMMGNTGIYIVMPSQKNIANIFFYAPVLVNDKIVGVLASSFDENTIRRLLDYKVYGAHASAGIVNTEGKSFLPLESMVVP